jgi:putative ABC transport system ATP-binding protein
MQTDPTLFLEVTHLNKEVPNGDSKITLLKNVNLTITKGESVAILGKSGSGKTTLLTLLAGLDLPTSGDIYFQQQHLNQLDEEARAQLRGNTIGFVFQSFQLLPTLTALENVMLPLEIQYVPYQRCKTEAINWLKKVGLSERLNHYPVKLSGGEQQRVAIARAFISQPTIIFADEMTGNLDTETGRSIADILFNLNSEHGTTLVLVTHDDSLATRCQRRLYLQEGVLLPC